jgi:hypothetical protein
MLVFIFFILFNICTLYSMYDGDRCTIAPALTTAGELDPTQLPPPVIKEFSSNWGNQPLFPTGCTPPSSQQLESEEFSTPPSTAASSNASSSRPSSPSESDQEYNSPKLSPTPSRHALTHSSNISAIKTPPLPRRSRSAPDLRQLKKIHNSFLNHPHPASAAIERNHLATSSGSTSVGSIPPYNPTATVRITSLPNNKDPHTVVITPDVSLGASTFQSSTDLTASQQQAAKEIEEGADPEYQRAKARASIPFWRRFFSFSGVASFVCGFAAYMTSKIPLSFWNKIPLQKDPEGTRTTAAVGLAAGAAVFASWAGYNAFSNKHTPHSRPVSSEGA